MPLVMNRWLNMKTMSAGTSTITDAPTIRSLKFALQDEFESLFGRPVDLLTRQSVERSPNKYFRHYALARTELLYERAA